MFRTDVGVDIQTRTEGGYHVAWIDSGEWIEFSIEVMESATYTITASVASMQSGSSFQIKFEKGSTRIWNVPSTGSWQTLTEVSQTIRLPRGKQIMRVEFLKGPFNLDKLVFKDQNSVALKANVVNTLAIYPNPCTGEFKIVAPSVAHAKIEILDLSGKRVFVAPFQPDVNGSATIKTYLECGVYLVNLHGDRQVVSKKIVVVNAFH